MKQKIENEIIVKEPNILSFRDEVHFQNSIIDGVFKNSYVFDKEKKNGSNIMNLNRHKIQHGDEILLDYGTEENMIRIFLYLDFAIKVIVGYESSLSNFPNNNR